MTPQANNKSPNAPTHQPKLPPPPPKRTATTAPKTPKKRKPTKWRKEFSAGFLLYRLTLTGRKWLLLDYGRHWDYAKGHLDPGESAWQAAVRELREETGIKRVDRVGTYRKIMTYRFISPKKGPIFKTVTYFLGQTDREKVTLSDEHVGFAWLSYEYAMQRLTFQNARDLLQAAEETLRSIDSKKKTA